MRVVKGEPVLLNTGRRLESMRKGLVSRGCGSFPVDSLPLPFLLLLLLLLLPLPIASLEAEAPSPAVCDIKKSL